MGLKLSVRLTMIVCCKVYRKQMENRIFMNMSEKSQESASIDGCKKGTSKSVVKILSFLDQISLLL